MSSTIATKGDKALNTCLENKAWMPRTRALASNTTMTVIRPWSLEQGLPDLVLELWICGKVVDDPILPDGGRPSSHRHSLPIGNRLLHRNPRERCDPRVDGNDVSEGTDPRQLHTRTKRRPCKQQAGSRAWSMAAKKNNNDDMRFTCRSEGVHNKTWSW